MAESGKARLTLTIDGMDYLILPVTSYDGNKKFLLKKKSDKGSRYLVQSINGVRSCSCADFHYRRERYQDECKHIKAMSIWSLV